MINFEVLKEVGVFVFIDDGVGIQIVGMMYEVMKWVVVIDKVIVVYCEDNFLIYGGSVYEGIFFKVNGFNGIFFVCEFVYIVCDVLLVEVVNCYYYVCYISMKEFVRVVCDVKKVGIWVIVEVLFYYLLFCDEDILGLDINYKMNFLFCGVEDRVVLIEGFLDGMIDFIVIDYVLYIEEEKNIEMRLVLFGIVGLEIVFLFLYIYFVKNGSWLLKQLIDYMIIKLCEVFGFLYGIL